MKETAMPFRNILLSLGTIAIVIAGAACRKSPVKPAIPKDKVEIVDGWIRLKQVEAGNDLGLGAMGPGESQFIIMGNPDSFMVDIPDFRSNSASDYLEVRVGARLVLSAPPKTVSAPAWEPEDIKPSQAAECGGGSTNCSAGWYGCGPLACERDGTIIGICCGGWTAANAPK
jgi:hypothetical protein